MTSMVRLRATTRPTTTSLFNLKEYQFKYSRRYYPPPSSVFPSGQRPMIVHAYEDNSIFAVRKFRKFLVLEIRTNIVSSVDAGDD